MSWVVSIIKVGCEVRSFEISDNPTLGHLLDEAGEYFVPNTITINTRNIVSEETRLSDGDRVFIGNKVKGNVPYVVEFIRLGQGQVIQVSAEGGQSINQCIDMMTAQNRAYFIGADGKEVFQYQISGNAMQGSDIVPTPITDGGTVRVICSTKVKGN
jgi:hypothetical protein